ncbi:MAG: hypothetical protein ACE5HE_02910 [Phycisphaerae bacterium]
MSDAQRPESVIAGKVAPVRPMAVLIVLTLALITFATRWLLRCDYLLQWDTLQSAAAISYYDVSLQLPHPPGAPVYAALLRIIGLVVANPHEAVLLTSSLADGVAAALIFTVGSLAISMRAGLLSSLLYLLSPLACHSATIGLTFGLDVSLGGAVALTAVLMRQRPTRVKAMLLGIVVALALGARYNPNWASMALVPLAVYGLRYGTGRHCVVFLCSVALVVALWALPVVLSHTGGQGYIATVADSFYRYSWNPSAASVALADGVGAGAKTWMASLAKYLTYVAKALGAALLLLPFSLVPPRARFAFREHMPWGLVAVWVLPAVLATAFGNNHMNEYLAVSFPPLTMVASIGVLRAAGLTRSLLVPLRIPRFRGEDRLEGAFAVSHVIVLAIVDLTLLILLVSLDASHSRSMNGRVLTSMRAQLRKPGEPFRHGEQALHFLHAVETGCKDDKALVLAKNRYEFLVLSLYAPQYVSLHVAVENDRCLAQFSTNHQYKTQVFTTDTSLPLPADLEVFYAPDHLAGSELKLPETMRETLATPHEAVALGETHAYNVSGDQLRLRWSGDSFLLLATRLSGDVETAHTAAARTVVPRGDE